MKRLQKYLERILPTFKKYEKITTIIAVLIIIASWIIALQYRAFPTLTIGLFISVLLLLLTAKAKLHG